MMKYSFVLLILTFIEKVHTKAIENKACRSKQLDILLMLDASENVSQEDFLKQLRIVSDMMNAFDTGPHKTRIRTLTVGDTTSAMNVGKLDRKDITKRNKHGKASTGDALFHLRTKAFSGRNDGHNIPIVGIVLLFGTPQDRERTRMEAKMAHEQRITLIVVGVGNQIDKAELAEIASSPQHIILVKDLNAMSKAENKLMNLTCEVHPAMLDNADVDIDKILHRGAKCSPKGTIDIMVAFDAARIGVLNSEFVLRFIAGVTDRLQINWNQSNVSVITNQCDILNLDDVILGTGNDARSVSRFFRRSNSSNISSLLQKVDQKFKNENKNLVLILIIPNTLSKTESIRAKQQLEEFKRKGVKIVVIGVGEHAVSDKQGKEMAASPKEYLFAPTFERLLGLEGRLLLSICGVPSKTI